MRFSAGLIWNIYIYIYINPCSRRDSPWLKLNPLQNSGEVQFNCLLHSFENEVNGRLEPLINPIFWILTFIIKFDYFVLIPFFFCFSNTDFHLVPGKCRRKTKTKQRKEKGNNWYSQFLFGNRFENVDRYKASSLSDKSILT